VSGWFNERSRIDDISADSIAQFSGIPIPSSGQLDDEYSHTSHAGRIGGEMRNLRYGNFGTKKGRSLGGRRSIIKHKQIQTRFKLRKSFDIPRKSRRLAEFVGIILGDGGVTPYQVQISLHRCLDAEYTGFVANLGYDLFGIKPSIFVRDNVAVVTFSSVALVQYLSTIGIGLGNKVRRQVQIPEWISQKAIFSQACVRGLIDTDGCVYIDRHQVKGKVFESLCLSFSNSSSPLLLGVHRSLLELGLRSYLYYKNVKLRTISDIKKYFLVIGSSNRKHIGKF